MIVHLHRSFEKRFVKLPKGIRERFKERRDLFIADPFHSLLKNHSLHEPFAGCRSINVTGDYRAIFYHESKNTVRFIAIGTHHELFGN